MGVQVAIGYDHSESVGLYVFSHSIHRRSSMPVHITPVNLKNLDGILTRARHPLQSTDFSFSRFLVPWKLGYSGWVIFADGDMLCLDDIAKLWALRDEKYSILCVKRGPQENIDKKFLGNVQTKYSKKNWSSVMLMNCKKLRMLTPEYVNTAEGLDLHQFRFLDEKEIGWLPRRWNHLVGYDEEANAGIVHFTLGGPYFKEYENCPYSKEWREEYKDMLHVKERSSSMLLLEEDQNEKSIASEQ